MKKRLLQSIQPLAARIPLNWLIKVTGQRLFLPFYHSVQKEQPLPHIKHLYPLRTVEVFEKELDFFLEHYKPIDLKGLYDQITSGKPFKENTFFLSFDDGLREIYDWIAPILLRKGIPATFFLNSTFVDNIDLFFRYKASLILEHLESQNISPATQQELSKLLKSEALKESILKINYAQRNLLDEIASMLELDFEAFLTEKKPYLTSDQINSLIKQGFTIGSHSIDHPLYSELDQKEQLRQTSTSQQFINEHFSQPIKAFAFPFTDHNVSASFFQKIKEQEMIDLSFGTAGIKKDTIACHLQRFPMEEFPASAGQLISSEYFYYFGKSLLNKNKIKRK